MKNKFLKFSNIATKNNLSFFGFLIVLRTFEFFLINNNNSIPENAYLFLFYGYAFDLLFTFIYTGLLLIPLFIVYYFSKQAAKVLYYFINFILLFLYFALILYFNETLIPLDSSLFIYSYLEIIETLNSGGGFSLLKIIYFIALGLLIISIFYFSKQLTIKKYIVYPFIVLSIISLGFISFIMPQRNNYMYDIEYYITSNKFVYFFDSIYDHLILQSKQSTYKKEILNKHINNYQKINNHFNFTSKEYPLLHKSSDYKDAIGKYFNTKKEKPNIIIIIVESLSRAFSGKDAYLGSFTPFLDSLAENSLYWKNTISTSERTFNALPSILASVPYGKTGFSFYRKKMPYHISLLELLHKEGYYSSFYHGGWNYFQDMGYFLDFSQINYMIEGDMGEGYNKFEENEEGFTWGYMDEDVFRKALEIETNNTKNLRLNIFLTLNIHSPFLPPKGDFYFKKFERIIKKRNLTEKEVEKYRKDKEKYAAVLSTDDAIKYFFNNYKKKKEFENTIFIITGDHRMVPIYHRSKIDKYHIPLIIYSPMLNTAKEFSAVVSHLDITPTIAAFLKNKYKIKLPSTIHWLGQILDTNSNFRNTRKVASMLNNRNISNYISGNYYVSEENLYKIDENLKLTDFKDTIIYKKIKRELENFKYLNLYLCDKNKIYPQKEYLNFLMYSNLFASKYIEHIEIESSNLYFNIIDNDFNNNIKIGLISFTGNINFKSKKNEILHIVMEISNKKNNKTIKREDFEITTNKIYNKTQNIKINRKINFSEIKKTSEYKIKVYFWNPNKLEFETNLKFEFYTK